MTYWQSNPAEFSIYSCDASLPPGMSLHGVVMVDKPSSLPISTLPPCLFKHSPFTNTSVYQVLHPSFPSFKQSSCRIRTLDLPLYAFFTNSPLTILSTWPHHFCVFLFTHSKLHSICTCALATSFIHTFTALPLRSTHYTDSSLIAHFDSIQTLAENYSSSPSNPPCLLPFLKYMLLQ